ncbi:DUF5701 family protein [Georgenia sp. MJ173]|uniref:DUF5701 family protein n=1 Tax=Georgenia sunbinii TaxID=3117728 RepID=UPI002F262C6F
MPQAVVQHRSDLPTLAAPSSAAATAFDPAASLSAELDRQVQVYLDLGLAELTGATPEGLRELAEPLRASLPVPDAAAADAVPAEDRVPFVLVLDVLRERPNDAVPAMRLGARTGMSVIDDDEIATYRPVARLDLPTGAYLLTGIDTGGRFLNVAPADALAAIDAEGRTPLTVAEGLALVTVRPDMLRPGRCFSLAGSRTGTNQRVPAVWISQRQPKLGWCWDRNPHTWLGTASAQGRTA